ncbi:MAG TPA: hypothetical protein VKA50_11300 [Gammaproteobacteria bacterium]|nr:hypothetical protein [Gammaproteobacteria bacterium]
MKHYLAVPLLAAMVAWPAMANAGDLPPLPVPHITDAPSRVPEGPSRKVHFSFSATPESASGDSLNYHLQQWFCPPGKDSAPTDISIQATPWAGQEAVCQLEENWGGMPPGTLSSDWFNIPVQNEPRLVPGTLYVRVQLVWLPPTGGTPVASGGWSPWHRTLVEDTHTAVFGGTQGMRVGRRQAGSVHIKVDMSGAKPPAIMAPKPAQVFHGGPISLSVTVSPHKPNSVWACCEVQWKRAIVVTKENNAYAEAHTPGHTAFPSTPQPYEMSSMTGFASNLKETGTSLHGSVFYNQLRPHKHTFGYRYLFRMREVYYPGGIGTEGDLGPFSAWHSFIVQEPIQAAMPYHGGMQMKPGAHMTKPSSGKQQSNQRETTRRLAPMPTLHRQ